MTIHDATEVAYKNGYEAGVLELYKAIIENDNNKDYSTIVAELLNKNK